MHQRIYLTLILLVAFALSACQPPLPTTIIKPDSSVVMEAEAAEKSGDYLLAAQRYFALASTSKGKQQALFYLRSALSYWQIRQYEQVLTSLENVNRQLLSSPQKVDAALLEAEVALAQSHPEHIVTALSSIDLQYADATQHKRTLELKISAYELTQNWLEKVNAHIELSPLLTEAGREQNQRAIWQSLMSLTPQALDLFNPGMAPAIDSGWFSLAYIIKSYQSNPDALTVAIEDWHRNYPNHPAKPDLYKKSLETGTRLPQQLNNIAILLPETGPYAAAARAIKQGIIAAHYTAHSDTGLHFLDIKTDKQTGQSNVWQQYQHAIELDASLVLGPLDKVSIQVLANAEELPVPVLALNRLTNNVQKYNLFQFGLAPEDDAIAVANYATRKGFQRAVILSPDSDWGKRVASTFSDQWLNSGGVLLNQGNYNESDSDFSSVIKPLFGLDASKERHTTLRQTLGIPLEFEPRRRQDIDFLFLAAQPLKARQLLPQLKFHRSGSLPIIATSHAYSGYENSQQDIDLNGLIINNIPWLFSDAALKDPAYMALRNNPPTNFEQSIRLYALGADAYRLIPELNSMTRSQETIFDGATGKLSINETGHINRETQWATFKRGKIRPLPPITDHSPQE